MRSGSESLAQRPGTSSRIIPASFATWTFGEEWLPEAFFTLDSDHPDSAIAFSQWIMESSWKGPTPNSVAPPEFIERILLGLGLGLKQLSHILFTEPDCMATNMPAYCLNAELPEWEAMIQAAAYLHTTVTM